MSVVARVILWALLALAAAVPPRRQPVQVSRACLNAPLAPECMP